MSHYIEIEDLNGLLPPGSVLQALDDDGDGEADELRFSEVRQAAEDAVNGVLSTSLTVPVASPSNYPFLKHVTRYEAARICYARRGYDVDSGRGFPHFTVWESAWKQLAKIGAGDLPLGPSSGDSGTRTNPRGAIITGPARTYSSGGRAAQ
jgi:hypothetical protein